MPPLYLPARDLHYYKGEFSFDTAIFMAEVKKLLPTYSITDPKTWPYVSLLKIEKVYKYRGVPDLPEHVAYAPEVLKRYQKMYSADEREDIATIQGSFHRRYPFNYDQSDELKERAGMTASEYRAYVKNTTKRQKRRGAQTPSVGPISTEQNATASAKTNNNAEPKIQGLCEKAICVMQRQDMAKLRGELSDKKIELLEVRTDLKEYVSTASRKLEQTMELLKAQPTQEHEELGKRVMDAENESELLREHHRWQAGRIKKLEDRLSKFEQLERLRAELIDDDETLRRTAMPIKRTRGERGDLVEAGDRVDKRIKVEILD